MARTDTSYLGTHDVLRGDLKIHVKSVYETESSEGHTVFTTEWTQCLTGAKTSHANFV